MSILSNKISKNASRRASKSIMYGMLQFKSYSNSMKAFSYKKLSVVHMCLQSRSYNAWVDFHILKLFEGLFRSPEGGQSQQYSPAHKITNMFVITFNGEDCYAAPSKKLRK